MPHVFAREETGLFYAFGWAQMQSHGNLILRAYGRARGRAAEYWGAADLDGDRWAQLNDIPKRAEQWYTAQTPSMRRNLDAFAAGINAYAHEHPEGLSDEVKIVLPVSAVDVLAHVQRSIHFELLANPAIIRDQIGQSANAGGSSGGSMAWAIGPQRSASGHSLLLINPHIPWEGTLLLYEAQLQGPGVDVYGAALIGFPVFAMGFNDHLGWTHTVNPLDGYDLYGLTLRDGGYVFDGEVRPFEVEHRVLKVKQTDGTLRDEALPVLHSVHGPVLYRQGNRAVALRVAGIAQPGIIQQYWDMARARDFASFESVLRRLQTPMFSILYADREGHILHLFGGRIPVRAKGDSLFWSGVVPGDTSETLWTETHSYEDLPRVVDPASGWLQNANDPPWWTTFPPVLDPAKFPAYLAPRGPLGLRAQIAIELLRARQRISLDDLIELKHSTHCVVADQWVDELIRAARQKGGAEALAAADVLDKWDRQFEEGSQGAVLFQSFVIAMARRRSPQQESSYKVPWQESDPLGTPRGLADPDAAVAALEGAAEQVRQQYGHLDVSWGEARRFRRGGVDLPGNGGPSYLGALRTINFTPAQDGTAVADNGETFIAAVEFSDPPRAQAILSYGNSSQPGSKHQGDQLQLLASKRLRPVWRSRALIEQHLEMREILIYPTSEPSKASKGISVVGQDDGKKRPRRRRLASG